MNPASTIVEGVVKGVVDVFIGFSKQGMKRTQFIHSALAQAQALRDSSEEYRHCNIMILNLAHANCPRNFNNIKSYATITWSKPFQRVDYGVWLFEDGEINHNGRDGGYINWAFSGCFERDGGLVKFSKRG